MTGCDLHDKSMLLRIAADRDEPITRSWGTSASARRAMAADVQRRAARCGARRIVFGYEACGFGFGLHDELTAAGIECHVLAPSKMAKSVKHRKRKTDQLDAQFILDAIRSYVLAGVALPSVWVPDLATRQDRELGRRRLAVAQDSSASQVRIRWLLKGHGIESAPGKAWTGAYWAWLDRLVEEELPASPAAALGSLTRQVRWLESEEAQWDAAIVALSQPPRYKAVVPARCQY
jgi:transposase